MTLGTQGHTLVQGRQDRLRIGEQMYAAHICTQARAELQRALVQSLLYA